MTPQRRIVVIGSVNMDLVCRTRRIPRAGETILGEGLLTIPGGKGANQAVAAARLADPNTEVHLVARVGVDDFGQRLLSSLTQHGVRTQHVTITEAVPTGCAIILVDQRGDNSIVVAPGANARLSPADIDRAEGLIHGASAVLLQLEVPLETVRHAIAICRRLGVFTILDPAPVPPRPLGRELLAAGLLVPNQTEAELLVGLEPTRRRTARKASNPKQVGGELLARGARTVVLKLGPKGALIIGRDGHIERVKSFKVEVADTTAAGDAFAGALAVAHAEQLPLPQAVRFANAAGAACCRQFGAQPALPARAEVERLMRKM